MPASCSISAFYENKCVFVTGATGFIGRFLVYRLLKTTHVSKIYILLRDKKGQSFAARHSKYLQEEIFKYLEDKSVLDKVVPLRGDITKPSLDMHSQDVQVLKKEVQVVFHAAASIKLTQSFKEAIFTQLGGMDHLLRVCEKMENRCTLVYLSSIANWFNHTLLEEKLYTGDLCQLVEGGVRKLIKSVASMEEKECDLLAQKYVGEWPLYPNNYALSKTLCEVLLDEERCSNLDVAIVRLPLLFSTLKDPEPGWFDVPQMGSAMVSLYANGVIRTTALNPDYDFSHIPLDMCVNALITCGWNVACCQQSKDTFKVINLDCNRDNLITVRQVSLIASQLGSTYPSIKQLRPPKSGVSRKPGKLYLSLHSLLSYTLFAHAVDLVLFVLGNKPVFISLTKRTQDGVQQIEKLLRSDVDAVVDNITEMYSQDSKLMSDLERDTFFYNVASIDWRQLFEAYHLRFRRKVLKEPDSNLEEARQRMKRVSAAYAFIKALLIAFILMPIYFVATSLLY